MAKSSTADGYLARLERTGQPTAFQSYPDEYTAVGWTRVAAAFGADLATVTRRVDGRVVYDNRRTS